MKKNFWGAVLGVLLVVLLVLAAAAAVVLVDARPLRLSGGGVASVPRLGGW